MTERKKLHVSLLGKVDYPEALQLQEQLLALRQQNQIPDTLLLLEHPPVLTMGRRAKGENILAPTAFLASQGITVHEINRGGDVTYHGPGQIVGYPIINLNGYGRDIHAFIQMLEEVFIQLLDREYGITARRESQTFTGVWVGGAKITAIGIAVKQWVTMHGFAFNVNPNLEHFRWIVPCGLQGREVTSLARLLGHTPEFDRVCHQVVDYFGRVFDVTPVILPKTELIPSAPESR